MGKPLGRKKINGGRKDGGERTSKAFDEDTAVFINMAQELKEEGNRLFQRRDHEGAMLKYEKAIKLLPRNHIDVAYLRSNMAACYMQMGIGEYPRAINECNLALEVAPKYSKALLKRAKCYEALNRLDLALRDVRHVLTVEPNNLTALETADVVKKKMEEKGQKIEDKETVLPPELPAPPARKAVKKKRRNNNKTANVEAVEEKAVVEEEEKVVTKSVKLVLGEDIRWAQLPVNCSIRAARDIVLDRFPNLKGALLKYRDQEGDLVTITTNEELRLAEASMDQRGSLRLYVAEVSPDQEPVYDEELRNPKRTDIVAKESGPICGGPICIEDWIVEFARHFKNHVGIESDSYLDIHEIGMKLYSEAMEGVVTAENSAALFEISAAKFQELAALALFNWGNVHMSRARKKVHFKDSDDPKDSVLGQLKSAYEWVRNEYAMAGRRYEESVRLKPDFYEGLLALGQQQFELAKLCWYYEIATRPDSATGPGLATGPSPEVMELYNKAEDSMERGMQMWEEMEEERLNGLSKYEEHKSQLREMGLDGLLKDVTPEEAEEQATNMRSQIYLLWGTLLYERSVMEYKLNLPTWEECLEVAVEKFELAGASQTDIAVMIKNHNSNDTALEGFKIDEIVQAWNEMYDSNRWRTGVPAFRLEPLLCRRVPHLHSVLETF